MVGGRRRGILRAGRLGGMGCNCFGSRVGRWEEGEQQARSILDV